MVAGLRGVYFAAVNRSSIILKFREIKYTDVPFTGISNNKFGIAKKIVGILGLIFF